MTKPPNTTDVLHRIMDLVCEVGVSFKMGHQVATILEENGYLWRDDAGRYHPIYHQPDEDADMYADGYDAGWRAAIRAQRNAWSRR